MLHMINNLKLVYCWSGKIQRVFSHFCQTDFLRSWHRAGCFQYFLVIFTGMWQLKRAVLNELPWIPSRFSRVWLFATPWTIAHQAPLSVGVSRQEYWSGLPCPPPGDLLVPGIEPASLVSPAAAGMFFTTSTIWDSLMLCLVMVSSFLMILDVPWYKRCYRWWFEATIDKYLVHFPLGPIINNAGEHNFAYSPKS